MNLTTYLSKVKKKVNFKVLSNEEKLLTYTIITDPHLSIVGVILLEPEVYCSQLSWSKETLRNSLNRLRELNIFGVIVSGRNVFICLPDYATKSPKADSTILKYEEALSQYPDSVRKFLSITLERKARFFKKPTPLEVNTYAIEQGYLIDGREFINYYNNISKDMGVVDKWFDKRGREIKDWKAKLRNVWLKPNQKIKIPDGAPEGFKFFFVEHKGKIVIPDFWKDGLPKSKQFYLNDILRDEYKRRKESSK